MPKYISSKYLDRVVEAISKDTRNGVNPHIVLALIYSWCQEMCNTGVTLPMICLAHDEILGVKPNPYVIHYEALRYCVEYSWSSNICADIGWCSTIRACIINGWRHAHLDENSEYLSADMFCDDIRPPKRYITPNVIRACNLGLVREDVSTEYGSDYVPSWEKPSPSSRHALIYTVEYILKYGDKTMANIGKMPYNPVDLNIHPAVLSGKVQKADGGASRVNMKLVKDLRKMSGIK